MESKLAVVHRSEIVRKGLQSMLNPIWKHDFVHSSDMQSYIERGYCRSCRMLAFIEAGQLDSVESCPKNSTMVAVYDNENLIRPCRLAAHQVTLNSSFDSFKIILDEFCEQSTVSSENELTQREMEILRLVAIGHSNKEIADVLFISIHTVITHRKNITGKLGIKSISGLTVYAIINRLINPDQLDLEKLI